MKYGLSEEQLAQIIQFIAGYSEIEQAVLFGSRAMDTFKEASDVDIALKGEKVTTALAAKLKFDIEEDTYLPFFFDFIAYPDLTNAALRGHIDTKGIVIFRRGVSEWRECRLGDVIKFGNGKSRPTSQGIYPIYGGNGILGYTAETNYEGETIVIGRVGAYYGATYYENKAIWVSDNALSAKAKHENNTKYLYFLLKNMDLNQHAQGSSHPLITQTLLNSIDVEIATDPSEQKAIAAILSSLDDKIDLLHRQNKTLEAMAETLFRQWFIEEAKEDWEKCCLGDCVTISYGRNLPTKNLVLEGYPVFGSNGQIGFFTNYTYLDPQVLVSCRGEASGVVNISLAKSYITNNSLVLERNKKQIISFEFLKYWALSYDFNLHVSGSAQPQITIDGLYDAILNLPDEHLIRSYSSIVFHFEQKRSFNVQQIQTLEKLRDNLLPKLMSGEVRVNVA